MTVQQSKDTFASAGAELPLAGVPMTVRDTGETMKAQPPQTLPILQRFNQAFVQHDGSLLEDLIAEDCVMESVEPAPDGTRYVGRSACLEFWQKLANSRDGAFTAEEIVGIGEHGFIRWRYRFGVGLSQSVRGVNVMRVRDGLIIAALGYVKSGDASKEKG